MFDPLPPDLTSSHHISRREFLKQAGIVSLGLLAGLNGWVATSPAATPNSHRLIVIMLRGAVDGLSVVVPYGDPNYYTARSQIAIPQSSLLALDHHFGLNPALQALMPFWKQGSLAFVQASGSTNSSRSHFDAQDYMENGTPGNKRTTTGWMNRLLTVLPDNHAPTRAVSFSNVMPKIFKGPQSVANMAIGRQAGRALPVDRPLISEAFDKLYSGNDPLSIAYREGMAARKTLLEDLSQEMVMADNGAPPAKGFAESAAKLAQVMVRDPHIQVVFTDLGGWDTHVNQGGVKGQLANKLQSLGNGLAVLLSGLGKTYPNTTVVVMSEFGRTVKENGNGGTDHGHGNVMWVAGGKIKGGQIYGDWPGLAPEALYEGRDLAITTDFRNVLAYLFSQNNGLNQAQLQQIFPGLTPAYKNIAGLVRT